jgi:hypothetical protein
LIVYVLVGQYHGLKFLFSDSAIPERPLKLSDLKAIFVARLTLMGTKLKVPEDRANGYGQWLMYLNRK